MVVPSPEKHQRLSDLSAEVSVYQEPETSPAIPVDTLVVPSFEEVPICRTGLALRISLDGARAFIVNRTDKELKLETGKLVAGYYT